MSSSFVTCPVCERRVLATSINEHLDRSCGREPPRSSSPAPDTPTPSSSQSESLAPIFSKKRKQLSITESPAETRQLSQRRVSSQESPLSFKRAKNANGQNDFAPLPERLRPKRLSHFVGQDHLTGPDSLLFNNVAAGPVGSIILWGPPGCGKTTLARLLALETNSILKELSATVVGINEIRAAFTEAKNHMALTGRRTIVFLDEDIFLPAIEKGDIQLIGATTENPSFKLNAALLSRCRVFQLNPLSGDHIKQIIRNGIHRLSNHSGDPGNDSSMPPPNPEHSPIAAYPQLTEKVIDTIASLSNGDARTALSLLELAVTSKAEKESQLLNHLRVSVSVSYDRTGDSHYDMISALHKSIRGSQGSAALYWLARMLTGGEDPVFIARRLVVCASEDVGLADNHALPLAMATIQACQLIGMPECRINLAHCVSYLSEAPKSTRAYQGYNRAEIAAKENPTLPVPLCVRNAPTSLMKELGYGEGYHYNPDYAHPVYNEYLPPQYGDANFLRPVGDDSDKIWDEDALKQWEVEMNHGEHWEGRNR